MSSPFGPICCGGGGAGIKTRLKSLTLVVVTRLKKTVLLSGLHAAPTSARAGGRMIISGGCASAQAATHRASNMTKQHRIVWSGLPSGTGQCLNSWQTGPGHNAYADGVPDCSEAHRQDSPIVYHSPPDREHPFLGSSWMCMGSRLTGATAHTGPRRGVVAVQPAKRATVQSHERKLVGPGRPAA